MNSEIRVRFAPSPTGPLHIGGVRTALFNYLFAKKNKGKVILRIEDTDQKRFVAGAEDYIIESLNWCNIPFDEGPGKDGGYGPYRQSERKDLYKQYAEQLIDAGFAYYAFDKPEDLDFHRKDHESKGKTFIYNWHNRQKLSNSISLSEEEVQQKIAEDEEYVIRFKWPKDSTVEFSDIIRGGIEIDSNTLDDKVLFKSDGMPTYHLANVVDDHLMNISHVIRGEEWLPSLALHQQMYKAFGWTSPKFAHLPLILKPTGKGKLSKRDGDKMGFPVFPLQWKDPNDDTVSAGYREEGYFPGAVVNFLAFLGWNPGSEQEIFNLNELISAFELEKVNKSGARFDPDKIRWFNHHYMQEQEDSELALQFKGMHPELAPIDLDYVKLVVSSIKERASFVQDFWGLSHYFFESPQEYDEKAFKKAIKEDTHNVLQEVKSIILSTREFTAQNVQYKVKEWVSANNIGFGRVMMPLRLALVGALEGIDVFEIIFMIGKNESVNRIDNLLNSL